MSIKRSPSQRSLYLIGALVALTGCSAGESVDAGAPEAAGDPTSPQAADQTPDQAPGVSSPSPSSRLKKSLPQAHASSRNNRTTRLHGVVATGSSPDSAAENFRQNHAKDLGVDPLELVLVAPPAVAQLTAPTASAPASMDTSDGVGLMFNPATGTYKFRLYTYQQQRAGVPVYGGGLRTLVRTDGEHPVVWVNTDLRPLGNFTAPGNVKTAAVDPEKSLLALKTSPALLQRGHLAPSALGEFSTPTQVIFAGVEDQLASPRLAIQYTAHDANGAGSWTFIADAETGDVLHLESNQHYNVDGTVQGQVIAGVEAMECGTLATKPLPHARVTSALGNAIANQNGAFSIVGSGTAAVSVSSSVTGAYFNVTDVSGSVNTLTLSVTPPGPAHFFHQDTASPPEIVLAQLNAYQQANALRDLLISHVPDYPVISTELGFQINVNHTGDTPMDLCARTGGAWYDGDQIPASINFCQRTDGRTNTAMGGIIHHEYGHHIIDAGGSKQAEYGEGMADTIAMLFTGNPALTLGYRYDCDEPLRQANNTCQYSESDCSSCGAGIYECGALISGIVWDIWQELKTTEPSSADDVIRSLVFSSIPMHTGTSIDPSIAIDMLTLDDDDTLLENGTPHYEEICTGFGLHNIDCPPIVDGLVVQGANLQASGPSDGPFEPASITYTLHNLGPAQSLTYAVQLPPSATWLSVDSTGGTIALGAQQTVTLSINQAQAAQLDNGRYTAAVNFINVSTGVGNVSREATLRVGAPEPVYTANFDDGLDGFIVDDSDYDNLWHQTTTCVDTLPGHSAPGSLYYGRDDECSHDTSVPNRHWVTSPSIRIDNPAVVDLGFKYYLRTERPGSDFAEVLMSVNNGPFAIVASNGLGGELLDETTSWEELRFEISELLPSTGPVNIKLQFSFDAGSPGDNNETGFLVDDVTVYATPASSTGLVIPGRIEAENYQRYFDTTVGNQGGGCNTGDNVDKEATGDSAGGGCNVGWTDAGEWLEYDINVATAQTFDIVARVATQNSGKSFRIEIDGVNVTGTRSVPARGWQTYSDVKVTGIPISAGHHVVRLFMITNYINVNYIDFVVSGSGTGTCTCPSGCSSVTNATLPFVRDGVTNACYFITGNATGHINSWNMTAVNLNGSNAANFWINASSYPARINGGYYLYLDGDYAWSHVEMN